MDIHNVIEKFHNDFAIFRDKNIYLYGTGNYAKIICENCKGFNIKGVLDRDKRNGSFCGIRIVVIEDICDDADVIIAAVSIVTEKIIYERIHEICGLCDIELYGIHTGNLFEAFGQGYWNLTENHLLSVDSLKKQIELHDIISMDIFDTLIMRKVLYPQDVFDIVELRAKSKGIALPSFHINRVQAEFVVFPLYHTFDAIYDIIKNVYRLTDEEVKIVKDIEIEVEKSVITIRRVMHDCLKFAKRLGKKVYLITDMYLPKEILNDVLNHHNIYEYDDIFVSGEYGACKSDGLFDIFRNEILAKTYLHIGDNAISDGIWARKSRIDAFVVRSAIDMLRISSWNEILHYSNTVNDRSVIGLVISRAFNNPFALKGEYFQVDCIEDFIQYFVAPMLTSFLTWLIKQIVSERYEKILFAARDGYLFQKMYDLARKKFIDLALPESSYLYISRRAMLKSGMESKDDIKDVELLLGKESLGLVFQTSNTNDVLLASAQYREGYRRYLKQMDLKDSGKYAFFDFTSTGTSQHFLNKILQSNVKGIYFCRCARKHSFDVDITAYYEEDGLNEDCFFSHSNIILESILTSEEPSLDYIGENGEIVYMETGKSDSELHYIRVAQKQIVEFYRDFIDCLYIDNVSISSSVGKRMWEFRSKPFTDVKKEIFKEITIDDSVFSTILYVSTQI